MKKIVINKNIDYYGTKDNYIHLKFGDCRKCYNFTKEFIKTYPKFTEQYSKYFMGEESLFKSPLEVINYIVYFKIPVSFYKNFTDEPCTHREAQEYLLEEFQASEYSRKEQLYRVKNIDGNYKYVSLDDEVMEA